MFRILPSISKARIDTRWRCRKELLNCEPESIYQLSVSKKNKINVASISQVEVQRTVGKSKSSRGIRQDFKDKKNV